MNNASFCHVLACHHSKPIRALWLYCLVYRQIKPYILHKINLVLKVIANLLSQTVSHQNEEILT